MPRIPRALRTLLAALAIILTVRYLWPGITLSGPLASSTLAKRRHAVESAFEHAWQGYAIHCMGHDTLHPVSNTCDDDFGGWGATAIDALSTAIIMEKADTVTEILRFIETIDFYNVKGGKNIQVFEVTIRHFGGMLSAWDLLDGPFRGLITNHNLKQSLYNQILELGHALTCAFDTPSGIPRNWVDPAACASDDGKSNTVAGAGSLILEFARLSHITGDVIYQHLAEISEDFLISPWPASGEPFPGLLGSFISVDNGFFLDSKGSWGALADSFYEYLLKAYVYAPDTYSKYLTRWKLAADSTIRYLGSHPYGHPDWTFLPFWEGTATTNAMDALSWFAGGNFILGGMITNNKTILDFGLSIADTGGAMYAMTTTGLGGEFVWWSENCEPGWVEGPCNADNSYRLSTVEFNLRPEVIESWYYAYRATRDSKYQEWAWSAFEAIEKYCKTNSGYSSISDVTAVDGGMKLDKQESFVYAEVLKYIYLMFEDEKEYQVQDSRKGKQNQWVFNTEGHPLKVASRISN